MQDFLIWWNAHGWWAHAGVLLGVEMLLGAFIGLLESSARHAMREGDSGGILLVLSKFVEALARFFCLVVFLYLFFSGFWSLWLTLSGLFR